VAAGKPKRPGEFALIERYFRPLATDPGAFDLIDDAALYAPPRGEELVLTVDTIAAGVHFFADDPPAAIARKALRVNLSDLAAKGATPAAYLMSLALPDGWSEAWVRTFAKGLADDQRRFGISLLGGDTTRASGGLTLTITAIGCVPKGRMVHRAGAKAGDVVFVSGTIGDAALGLGVRLGTVAAPKAAAAYLRDRYLNPQPRTALAPLVRRFANSAMDVSDGLVGDLAHICKASGVGAEIEAGQVPLSRQARAVVAGNRRALGTALTGGDDYEILATVTKSRAGRFAAAARSAGVPVTRIGRIVEGSDPPLVLGPDGRPMAFAGLGHTHF
jgi:thiamine-monophosphate kinase